MRHENNPAGRGASPGWRAILATRNPGAGQDFTGLAAAVRLRLRVAFFLPGPMAGIGGAILSLVDNKVAFCYLMFMGQPVKMSDALVLDARLTGETAERSIAGQIEFWARLGRAIEPLLRGDRALALRRSGDAAPLSKRLGSVDSPEGRRRLAGHLKTLPYPHYEPADSPGLLVKIEADGRRTLGRFVNRRFQAVKKTGA